MKNQLSLLIPAGAALRNVPNPVRVIGIDLGTTNSSVAEIIWHPEENTGLRVRCLEIDQETLSGLYTHTLIPSAVAVYKGKEWVGEGAKRLHTRAPEFGLELTRNLFLECKNDIGSRRTYHKAPEGYRSASEIGGKILRFLKDAALAQSDVPCTRTVVTVPASFQAAQRIDTVNAAKTAGIELSSGDLLDEPVAAFLDYALSNREALKGILSKPQNLVVFDFGGGTCDVAVLQVSKSELNDSLQIYALAVSRYHRLGGGDIDRAILHEALLPQLLKQNGMESFELTFDDKKNIIEPSYLGVAEALKVGLCNEIARLQAFDQYDTSGKSQILKKQPGVHACSVGGRVLQLNSPSLSAAQFEDILKPFLDRDLLYARETEYRLTCSIFAPLQDALDRSKLTAEDVDLCLLVGGSSLIPQVVASIRQFFTKGKLLTFPDRDSAQVAVARGAAIHALALALYGKSIFQAAVSDRLSIRTKQGSYELLPRGATLPFPAGNEWHQTCELTVSETSIAKPVSMRIELLAGPSDDLRPLFNAIWVIPPPVSIGDKLRLEYRMDENQVLHFRLSMDDRPDAPAYEGLLENPLSNVVNPHAKRLKIQADEEDLRIGAIPQSDIPDKVVEIARDYAEIQQTEKAISYLKQALRMKNGPDGSILNLLGIYHGERGDFDNQEKFYREAASAGVGRTSLFNLALSQYNRRKFECARQTIEELLKTNPDGSILTLAALVEDALGNASAKDLHLKIALGKFGSVRSLEDWGLGWLLTAARLAGKDDLLEKAQAEKKRRTKGSTDTGESGGMLPDVAGTIKKK